MTKKKIEIFWNFFFFKLEFRPLPGEMPIKYIRHFLANCRTVHHELKNQIFKHGFMVKSAKMCFGHAQLLRDLVAPGRPVKGGIFSGMGRNVCGWNIIEFTQQEGCFSAILIFAHNSMIFNPNFLNPERRVLEHLEQLLDFKYDLTKGPKALKPNLPTFAFHPPLHSYWWALLRHSKTTNNHFLSKNYLW